MLAEHYLRHGLQLLLLLHVGVREIVDGRLTGCISIGKVLDAFVPALLGILIFLYISAESKFSCFRPLLHGDVCLAVRRSP